VPLLLLLLRPLTATSPHDTKPCNSTIFQRKGRKRSKSTMTQNLSRRIAGLVRPAIPLALAALSAAATAAAADKAPADGVSVNGAPVPSLTRATPLTFDEFRRLHAAITPGAGPRERWAEIPWQPNLVQARERARRENKPIILWLMDGHPLGCT
jgi:hypothetical protein